MIPVLLTWVLLFLLRHSQSSAATTIFILAGQSNMAGRGGVSGQLWDGVVPPASRPTPSILRLGPTLVWAEAREPLHAGIDSSAGIGPGMAFAREILRRGFSSPVGLVPCAMGGTNISHWEKGGTLYRRMLRRARAAVVGPGGGPVGALLWYQGESDTIVKSDAESYGRALVKLFEDVRMDLMAPMLPIIQVGLASGEGMFIETVREAQFGIDLMNVRTIDAKGLALQPDNLHLTTESQVQLGKLMAKAFLQFMPKHLSSANSIDTTILTTNYNSADHTTTTFSIILLSILILTVFQRYS